MKKKFGIILAGFCAGAANGTFGAGGGMVLVPLLILLTDFDEKSLFSSSVAIILPICLVSLAITALVSSVAWHQAVPYLIGSVIGGLLAGKYGNRLPAKWLHRALAIFILWGGIRNLC